MLKKFLKVMMFCLAFVLILTACSTGNKKTGSDEMDSSANEGSEKAANQVLNLSVNSEIPSMDSSLATDSVSFDVMNNVFEGLYRLDKNNKPTPGVAKDVKISEDGKVYTFLLNEKAKWSNGTPVTAKDFIYSWRKALHPNTLSEYAYIMAPIKNANAIQTENNPLYGKVEELGVKAINDTTLEVTLEAPAPYFLGLTGFATFYPQNEEYVKSQGNNFALEASNLIYNGPFTLSDWQHEVGWQYKKNENYWDEKEVNLDEINVKVIKDVATNVNLYETNEVDRVALSAEYVDQFKDHEEYQTELTSSVFFMRMNQENKVLRNVDIRKAIDSGWDKKALTEVILNDGSIPAYSLVPKDFVSSPDGTDFRKENGDFGQYDADKAQKFWSKGLKEIGKKEVKLEFLIYDSDASKKVGEYIKNQLEKNLPGLTVTIKAQPFKQKLELESSKEYDFSYAGWGPDYQDSMTFLDMWITDGSHNQMSYSNAKFDKLINDAKSEPDQKKRWKKLLEAEKTMFEDQAISSMFQDGQSYLQKKYVKDIINHPFGASYSYKWAYISK